MFATLHLFPDLWVVTDHFHKAHWTSVMCSRHSQILCSSFGRGVCLSFSSSSLNHVRLLLLQPFLFSQIHIIQHNRSKTWLRASQRLSKLMWVEAEGSRSHYVSECIVCFQRRRQACVLVILLFFLSEMSSSFSSLSAELVGNEVSI